MIEVPQKLFKELFDLLVWLVDVAYTESQVDLKKDIELIDRFARLGGYRMRFKKGVGIETYSEKEGSWRLR